MKTAIKPTKVVEANVKDLPKRYYQSLAAASDGNDLTQCQRVRIETYKRKDIQALLKTWDWPDSLADITEELDQGDRDRITKIMKAIPTEGAWPYVSYWAEDMDELATVEVENYTYWIDDEKFEEEEISVPNHGDGWHRLVAQLELKKRTFEIMFLVR